MGVKRGCEKKKPKQKKAERSMISQCGKGKWALYCGECDRADDGYMDQRGEFYCAECWEFDGLRRTRCFSFAVVYDSETEESLSFAASQLGVGCAERQALWKLDDTTSNKTVVVCRIRRYKKKMSFGMSKPCEQCIQAMSFYNVTNVCYSEKNGEFTWVDPAELSNTYRSKSKTILRL